MGQLYNITLIHYIPLPLLEDINSILTLQKDGIRAYWFATEETTFINSSRNIFIVDKCTLYNKGDAFGAIAIPVIESTYLKMTVSK